MRIHLFSTSPIVSVSVGCCILNSSMISPTTLTKRSRSSTNCCLCDVNLCNANLCAQLPQTQFTHSKAPNPHASKTSTQNFRTSYWHNYPERNLHTARHQTRMPARHPNKIFAPPIGAATPNAIYTQQGAKPACQQDIRTKFSHLLLAQLPRTQFTHSKAPNPHASRTSSPASAASREHQSVHQTPCKC